MTRTLLGTTLMVLLSILMSLFCSCTDQKSTDEATAGWAIMMGNSDLDSAHAVFLTHEQGLVLAGYVDKTSFCYPVFGSLLLLNCDNWGRVLWQKTYTLGVDDRATSIARSAQGYAVAGMVDIAGYDSAAVLFIDHSGNVVWQKIYDLPSTRPRSIIHTNDGGFLVAGDHYTSLDQGNVFLLKIDHSGELIWQRSLGGGNQDCCNEVIQTQDNGYIFAGCTYSSDYSDVWVVKLDSAGAIKWQKKYGYSKFDSAHSIRETHDGGYIVAGQTDTIGSGYSDVWLLKLNSNGSIEWQKAYGGVLSEEAHTVSLGPDSGYIVAGFTYSFGKGGLYGSDAWIIRVTESGDLLWQKTYGSSENDEEIHDLKITDKGELIAVGSTYHTHDDGDVLILHLDPLGEITDCDFIGVSDATAYTTTVTGIETNHRLTQLNGAAPNYSADIQTCSLKETVICTESVE